MHKEGLHLDLFISMHLQFSARTLTALCMSSSKSKGFRSIASSGASGLCNALSDISRAAGVSPAIRASDRLFALQTEARLCVDACVQVQAVCLPRPCRVCFEPSSQRPIQVQVIYPPFLTTRKLQPTATVAGLEMECLVREKEELEHLCAMKVQQTAECAPMASILAKA